MTLYLKHNMIDIDDFLPEMRAHVEAVPDPAAYRFIRNAARMLCETTRIWREIVTMTISGDLEERFTSVPDANIVEIEYAEINDVELKPKTPDELDELVTQWSDPDSTASSPKYITQLGPNSFTLVPRVAGSLLMRLILKTSRDALTLPEFLLDEHAEAIGKGAAGQAMKTPNKEYSDPRRAKDLETEFNRAVGALKYRTARTKAKGRLTVTPRYI